MVREVGPGGGLFSGGVEEVNGVVDSIAFIRDRRDSDTRYSMVQGGGCRGLGGEGGGGTEVGGGTGLEDGNTTSSWQYRVQYQ